MSAVQAIKNTVCEGLTKAGVGNSIQIIDGQPYSSLASGYKIPLFGLGTWSGGQEEDKGMTYKAVKEAIKQGYRHIDCAYCYGNEGEVGDAITESVKEGTIKREDLFVTTKLWIEFMQPDAAKKVFQEQLDALQLKYLDLFMIHNPYTNNVGPVGQLEPPSEVTYKALEDLVDAGKVRSLGVSNFSIKKLDALRKHIKKPISVHQIEIHPVWPNSDMVDYCQKANIHVTAYSPLGASSSDSQRNFKMIRALDQPIVKELAEKYGRSAGNVALRWGLQRGLSVVPKSTNPKRIFENSQCLTFELKDEDVKAITDKVQPKVRALRFTFMYRKPGPFPDYESFWDEPDHLGDYLKATGQGDLWEDAKKKGDFI